MEAIDQVNMEEKVNEVQKKNKGAVLLCFYKPFFLDLDEQCYVKG